MVVTELGDDRCRVLISHRGARIVSFADRDGVEWLHRTDRVEPPSDPPPDFVDGTRAGWDECIPSIDPDPDPGRAGSPRVADHGDFWFADWTVRDVMAFSATFDSASIAHPLRIRKSLEVDPASESLTVHYLVENNGLGEYGFLYSAHPLLSWAGPLRLDVPGGGEVRSAFGYPASLAGDWAGLAARLDRVEAGRSPSARKFFVRWADRATLWHADRGAGIEFRATGSAAGWLGVCVNDDSWPRAGAGESWIALEPTSAPTDSLAEAQRTGQDIRVPAGGTVSWSLSVAIRRQPPAPGW